MQVEITGKAAEIIQRLVTSGRYGSAEEAVTAMATAAVEKLDRSALLPDPPLPDESISAPCDLPLPPGKPVKVTRGVMPLPDPIDFE